MRLIPTIMLACSAFVAPGVAADPAKLAEAYALEQRILACAAVTNGPRINIKELGAIGDGEADDTDAFIKAAEQLGEAGGGTLVIPKGIYRVGRQFHVNGEEPYYQSATIFFAKNLGGLVIEGNGATVRMAEGLRNGSFSPETGERFDPGPQVDLPVFVDKRYMAKPGNILTIRGCENVLIQNLELDGNINELMLGGRFGDQGWQTPSHGLWIYDCTNVVIRDLMTHHNGADGLIVGYEHLKEDDEAHPHYLIDIDSQYNGRQGISIVGGKGITVLRSKFNHTGRAAFHSSPAAGIDIEAEDAVNRDILFIDCEAINNVGCGMVADTGDSKDIRFVGCTFWGSTNWSAWPRKPGISFENCRFHGTVVNAFGSPDPKLATKFIRCHFEDIRDGDYAIHDVSALITISGHNVLLKDCTMVAHKTRALYIDDGGNREIIDGCKITHRWDDAPDQDFQSLIRGATISNTFFTEERLSGNYYIALAGVEVKEGVEVHGPRCKWQNWSWGTTGKIKPGKY